MHKDKEVLVTILENFEKKLVLSLNQKKYSVPSLKIWKTNPSKQIFIVRDWVWWL